MKQDWLLHRFIRYKFVSYGKQRLPHSSGDNRLNNHTLQAIIACLFKIILFKIIQLIMKDLLFTPLTYTYTRVSYIFITTL